MTHLYFYGKQKHEGKWFELVEAILCLIPDVSIPAWLILFQQLCHLRLSLSTSNKRHGIGLACTQMEDCLWKNQVSQETYASLKISSPSEEKKGLSVDSTKLPEFVCTRHWNTLQ